ncbi:MAG: hypothetical protein ACP5OC_05425 [Thermoplasmata archaeon]
MKISDGFRRLDRKCVIAILLRGGIFDLMVRTEETIPAYVFSNSGSTYLQLFFQKGISRTSAINSILSREGLVEKRSYFSLTEKIESRKGTHVITELTKIPSVTMSNAYLQKSELFIDFRFHHSKLLQVNAMLSNVIGDQPDFRIVSMSISGTLREKLESMHSQTRLSIARFSITLPEENEIVSYVKNNHPEAVAEIEGRVLSEKGVKVILYTEKPVELPGIEIISKEDNIYEFYVLQSPLFEARRLGNEARIPRVAFFVTIENNRLHDITFSPTSEADEFLGIMMQLRTGGDQGFPVLEYYSEINPELWGWL